ncbi:MAG: SAM-dependent DNA methyltransferase, partial [Armatimonadetes bacterium]|nr:SAM-dependent DNA methyltransferase [Armatimonadota bacterium]
TLPSPVLVVGNLPWVTNAALGVMGGANLPQKSNFQRHSGFAAKTGKANFDISEWMLIKLLEALQGIPAVLAMLCKTSTARKVLRHAWKDGWEIGPSSLHLIDASQHFGVSVDACLLLTHTGNGKVEATATTYSDLGFARPLRTFGLFAGDLVSDVDAYRELRDLDGLEYRKWRSGAKHDAAGVMEFTREGACLINGLGEKCDIEDDYLYPLLKSSDLANGRLVPAKYVLLPQRCMSDDTAQVEFLAPKTWQYLLAHAEQLDQRRSSIYANRPRFAVFGIGDYTFSSWKVAISGLYKNLVFQVVGHHEDKPIVLDDTCYFIPCETEQEATFLCDLLNSQIAGRFIASLVFPDSKRPVTIDVLKRIDLMRVGERLDRARETQDYLAPPAIESSHQRLLVFDEREEYHTGTDSTSRAGAV